MCYEKSVAERRAEVFNWLDNLIASYENYREFAKFPGNEEVSTFEGKCSAKGLHTRLQIFNLKTLCDYANIHYTRKSYTFFSCIEVEYKGITLYDER